MYINSLHKKKQRKMGMDNKIYSGHLNIVDAAGSIDP
jgi:hypothetical protein